MVDYFVIKRADLDSFLVINPQVIRSPGLYKGQIRAMIALVQKQTERMAVHKNQLVPFAQVVQDKVVSKSGS